MSPCLYTREVLQRPKVRGVFRVMVAALTLPSQIRFSGAAKVKSSARAAILEMIQVRVLLSGVALHWYLSSSSFTVTV